MHSADAARPRPGRRARRALRPGWLWPALLFGFVVGPALASPTEDGARRLERRPFVCGSGPGLEEAIARRRAAGPPRTPRPVEALGDLDVGNLAVLMDAGDLVVSGFTDTNAIVQQFYESHPDVFDYVAIFVSSAYDSDVQIESGFAFHRRVASDVLGIGVAPIDRATELGLTTTRLRSILQWNDLLEYPPRLDDRMLQFTGDVRGVAILGHEVAHQFVAFADAAGGGLEGRGGSHWSFFFNSQGSVMEGNRWVQSGNQFTSVGAFERYSQLDLYLMGMLDPGVVSEPIFVIDNPKQTGGRLPTSFPEVGVTIQGSRRDLTIADVVAVEGTRVPSHVDAPHGFTLAMALVVPAGMSVPPGDLDRVESFRRTLLEWFADRTGGIGSIDTSLPGVDVVADFEAEVFAGPAPLSVPFLDRSEGAVDSWSWQFGDGGVSSSRDPVHVYDDPGFYTVRLTVDGPGGPSTRTQHHLVLVQPFQVLLEETFEAGEAGWGPSPGDTAASGRWVLADPEPTGRIEIPVQPDDDATPAPGTLCWITGNQEDPGGVAGSDDVDGGATRLISDLYDLSGAQLPVLEYSVWYSNGLGGEPGTDPFVVEASPDGGALWLPLDSTRREDRTWRRRQVRLTRAIAPTSQVRVRFVAADLGLGSLVEAGVDDVRLLMLSGLPDGDADAIPDEIDNCPEASNRSQFDDDEDGTGAVCDCDDADPAAARFASDDGVIEALPADPGRFRWTPDPLALDYNVYKGSVAPGASFTYNEACFEKRSLDTQTFDPTLPAVGGFHFYLVAPRNLCGETGLGIASSGAPRPLATSCPPPIGPGG